MPMYSARMWCNNCLSTCSNSLNETSVSQPFYLFEYKSPFLAIIIRSFTRYTQYHNHSMNRHSFILRRRYTWDYSLMVNGKISGMTPTAPMANLNAAQHSFATGLRLISRLSFRDKAGDTIYM